MPIAPISVLFRETAVTTAAIAMLMATPMSTPTVPRKNMCGSAKKNAADMSSTSTRSAAAARAMETTNRPYGPTRNNRKRPVFRRICGLNRIVLADIDDLVAQQTLDRLPSGTMPDARCICTPIDCPSSVHPLHCNVRRHREVPLAQLVHERRHREILLRPPDARLHRGLEHQ